MQGLLLVQLFARVVFCTRLKHPRSCLVQVVRLKRTLLSRSEIVGSLESDEGLPSGPPWTKTKKNALRKWHDFLVASLENYSCEMLEVICSQQTLHA